MLGNFRAIALAGASLAAVALGTASAEAGAFGLRDQSAIGLGMSFAGAGAGAAGVSSMFWNPATVTMRPGWVSEQNLTFINLQGDIRTLPGTSAPYSALPGSGDIGKGAVLPSGATSYQLNDRLWIGIQTGAPFGLVTKPRDVWAGEAYGRSNRIFSLAFNPVVGFKVTDWLSVAAGPNIEYFRLTLRQAVPLTPLLPATALPSSFIKGDSWGVGFTAGALITAPTGTTLGVGYRSSVHHDIDGSIGVPLLALAPLAGQVRAKLNTPEKVTAGITQVISPVFRMSLGFEWDNWSRLGDVGIVSKTLGVTVNHLPLRYKDGYTYSLGGEYDWSPNLTLRAGVSYEQSPIDFENRSVRLPDADRVGLSIGASYRWNEKLLLTAGYQHLFVERGRILAGAGRDYNVSNALGQSIAFAGVADGSADIVSVGFRYQFGEPAVVAAPAPLVRKY